MTLQPFVDYYETLQLSPNASLETVERVYRLLAKRYHPDNQATGNADQFSAVLEAYQVLSDPARRAAFDVRYDEQRTHTWRVFDQAEAGDSRADDRRLFQGILSLLYAARRRDPIAGGLGILRMEKMLGCPQEHLAFPIWYLRSRGWIETLDNGMFAITVEGIDQVGQFDTATPAARLLPESSLG